MKEITIFQENIKPIKIIDEDDENNFDYIKKLSNILESNNITILETKTTSMILRPNKINSIIIKNKSNNKNNSTIKKNQIKKEDDTITDMVN